MLICMFAEPTQKVFEARILTAIDPPQWSAMFVEIRICKDLGDLSRVDNAVYYIVKLKQTQGLLSQG